MLKTQIRILSRALQLFLFLSLFVISSCNNNALFEKNISLEVGTWNVENILEYDVDIQDTTLPYDFYLNLRHNEDYEFSNIFLFVDTEYPSLETTRDTIEILLATTAGKWYGKGFGSLKEVNILLKRGVYFPASGNYKFKFSQAMRTENLEGVEDFGILIEKTER